MKEITLDNGEVIKVSAAPFTRANAEIIGGATAIGSGAPPDALAKLHDLLSECIAENHSPEFVAELWATKMIRISMEPGSVFRSLLAAASGH
jgi:hypothetical protein